MALLIDLISGEALRSRVLRRLQLTQDVRPATLECAVRGEMRKHGYSDPSKADLRDLVRVFAPDLPIIKL